MQYLPTWSDVLFLNGETRRSKPVERANVNTAEVALTPPVAPAPVPVAYAREIYAVGGHRVTNDRTGWKCECRAFAPNSHCPHVREALVLRQIRQSGKQS